MNKLISLILTLIMLLASACGTGKPADKPQDGTGDKAEDPGPGTLADLGDITYVPYDTEWETKNVIIFGDGVITANNMGDLIMLFAECDGFNVEMTPVVYDNLGKAGKTSSYNLYELYTWATKYSKIATINRGSNNVKKMMNAIEDKETPIDYLILDTGRDRTLIPQDYFSLGGELVTGELYKYFKEHNPNGKLVLLTPPPYKDGSVAFGTAYKVNDSTGSVGEKTTTLSGHSELIEQYANRLLKAANNDATLSSVGAAFDYFYKNYADSGIELYQGDLTFPSAAGSYYMAAVLYGSLFNKSTAQMPVYGFIDEATAKILQNAAHSFVFGTDPNAVKREANYKRLPISPAQMDQRNKPSNGEAYTDEVYSEYYDVILASAYSFYARGAFIQYDNITNSNTYPSLLRREVETVAEDATPQNRSYLDCSSFVYSVYNNSFGYNFNGATDTVQFLKQTKDRIFHYDINTTDFTEPEAIEAFLKAIQPGDMMVYTGHAMLYLGNGMMIHCMSYQASGGASNYIIDAKLDAKEMFGGIRYESIDTLMNPLSPRYMFDGEEIAVFRPLDSGIIPTENGKNRAESLMGITVYKTTTAPFGITVNPGDDVTVTFTIKNDNENECSVSLTDVLPAGFTLKEGDFAAADTGIAVTVKVPANRAKTVSYTVTVPADAVLGSAVIFDSAKANGVALNTTTVLVDTTLTTEQKNSLSAAAASSNADSTIKLITSAYKNGLSKDLSFSTEAELFSSCFELNSAKAKATVKYTDIGQEDMVLDTIVAGNLYGGKYFSELGMPYPYIETVTAENVAVGDILMLVSDQAAKDITLYLCVKPGILASIENGKYTELSVFNSMAVFESTFGYSYFCVARPSQTF